MNGKSVNWVHYLRTRILGLSGSPRTGSNTSILIETALAAAEKEGAVIEFIDLSFQNVKSCEHCNECSKLGKCKIDDDDVNKIAETMKAADGIILGSPDHYGSVSASMKNLMDRIGRFLHLEGKVGCGLVVGRRSGIEIALSHLLFFLLVKEMIVPGGVYWPIGFSLNAGDVRADTEAMVMAAQMGKRVAILASTLVRNPVPWIHEPRNVGPKVRFGDEWK
ncbi:MAG: flavodoxin family protein [Candidatus Thorarchaeota archaeon]|nr:flavodoxin family protein [Candidatus Thorarchaeota archaeon]